MRKGRQAPPALLAGLTTFLLTQAVLTAVVQLGADLRDPPFTTRVSRLKGRLEASPRPLTLVQVGSSRTIYGLRGGEAEPWLGEQLGRPVVLFSLGVAGGGPLSNLVTFQRLLNSGVRPDCLLVEVLPPLLGDQHPVGGVRPSLLPARTLRYDEMRLLDRYAGRDRPGLWREWWTAQAIPVYSHRFSLLSRCAPILLPLLSRTDTWTNIDDAGWVAWPPWPPEDEARALAGARQTYQPALANFRLNPDLLLALRQTIDLAHERGIQVALVLMPEGPIFRSWYPAPTWERIDTALQRLCRGSAAYPC
jgi:hypothetical protein